MMNEMKFNHERFNKDMKRAYTLLTVITNCFIICGVIHHWRPKVKDTTIDDSWNNTYRLTVTHVNNTKLATPFKEVAEIQQKATGYTSSTKTN